MEPIHIADIPKSRGEVIRVEITEYSGKKLLNIRIWYTDKEGKLAPTKKGVALNIEQFDDLKNALAEAENKIKALENGN